MNGTIVIFFRLLSSCRTNFYGCLFFVQVFFLVNDREIRMNSQAARGYDDRMNTVY